MTTETTNVNGPADPRTATDGEPSGTPLTTLRMWAILGVVLVADALDMLDSTITNLAAPTIEHDLGGGPTLIKWLGAAYALALGALLVVGGRLGDRYGQRRLFLLGMAGFTVASLVCGVSIDPVMLIVFRAVQGAFGALLIPQGMAIMTKAFTPEMRAKAFGAFGPLLGIAMVGGPLLAGFMIDADIAGLSWRPMFLVNIVLGVVGLALAVRILPHDTGDRAATVDLLGAGLLAAAMFAVLYGLITGSSDGWTALPIGLLIAAAPLFAAFAWRQTVAVSPLLKPALFRNRGFTSGLTMGLLYFAAMQGLLYVVSLFLQLGMGYSPRKTSLALVPMTLGIMIAAGACMALLGTLGRRLVLIGLALTTAGAGAMLYVVRTDGVDASWLQIALVVFLVGLGAGTCFGTIFDTALGDIAPDEAGAASGSLSAVQQLAAGIGSAAVTSVYFSTLASDGQVRAMTVSLLVVGGICVLCLAAVRLLPRQAAELEH